MQLDTSGVAAGQTHKLKMADADIDLNNVKSTFSSTAQAMTLGGLVTGAHGLGAAPNIVQAWAQNVTAERNWVAGNQTLLGGGFDHIGAAGGYGVAVYSDATNVYARIGVNSFQGLMGNKTTGAAFAPTLANWNLVLKARL